MSEFVVINGNSKHSVEIVVAMSRVELEDYETCELRLHGTFLAKIRGAGFKGEDKEVSISKEEYNRIKSLMLNSGRLEKLEAEVKELREAVKRFDGTAISCLNMGQI